ncbi:hypothetical protein N3K66_003244 [Trichothecium roseum]|uniref:Uncharacterized protein n=1 Tax=Trichothecium roseum TaxID=47278 RepID=A0ACC0V6N2_9HYPO|nr:hypothetical protein N3K66_003244 [Trichothecium roseum]
MASLTETMIETVSESQHDFHPTTRIASQALEFDSPLRMSDRGAPPNASFTKLQNGKMVWSEDIGTPEPEWPKSELKQDSIKAVLSPCLDKLGIGSVQDFDLGYFSEGGYNKVFLLVNKSTGTEFIFRICLPVYPWYKTESEVATMEFVRERTEIPVPKVYAFDSSADNELGYEWILMERLSGVRYKDVDDKLDMDSRLAIARKLAEWYTNSRSIGSPILGACT